MPRDAQQAPDSLGIIPLLFAQDSLLGLRDRHLNADDRVWEMRDFVFGWASSRV
jgi:hypothetical protein